MKNFEQISDKFIIPLITAAAVLRDENRLRSLLGIASGKKFNSRKIYEALLQSYLFAGFPSALLSLKIFNEFFPQKNKKFKPVSGNKVINRGIITCKKIYGDKYYKLISNVSSFSPELSQWLISEGYGKVLSRKPLNLKVRELVNIAILTVLKFEEQLYSHINGAYRME
jgi:4-carboxymuconolactone decarboxylase